MTKLIITFFAIGIIALAGLIYNQWHFSTELKQEQMERNKLIATMEKDIMMIDSLLKELNKREIVKINRIMIKIMKLKSHQVNMTAYTARPEETDDTPFITASGDSVFEGGVAVSRNLMSQYGFNFGEIIYVYGENWNDKVLIVNDRMHNRKKNWIDVFMWDLQDALNLGKTKTRAYLLG